MNFLFAAVETLYVAGLMTIVVGDLLLGALVLPAVFGTLPERALAGSVASVILARFRVVKWVCLAVLAASAAVRYKLWEGPAWPIHARHAALAVLALALLTSQLELSPRIEALRPAMAQSPSDAVRAEFARLHAWAVRAGLLETAAGLAALYFS